MSNELILQTASTYLKANYPELTAEAMIAFLVTVADDGQVVDEIAAKMGMSEPAAYHHLKLLGSSGAKLISIENLGDGRNLVNLTDLGLAAKEAINAALSAVL